MGEPRRTEEAAARGRRELAAGVTPRGAALHLAALSGFAIAQPLFDILGPNPTFFVAHAASASDLVAWALFLALGLPAIMFLADLVALRWLPVVAPAFHLTQIGVLASLFTAVAIRSTTTVPAWLTAVVVVGTAVVFVLVYRRWEIARSFLAVLSPAVFVFLGFFLFFSPSSSLVVSGREDQAELTVGVENAAPVVLVIFDELPTTSLMDDRLLVNGERFPHFASLAATSTWYRGASTVAQNTSYAVPAILTGRYPEGTRAPHVTDYPENLFTLLAPSHELRAVEILTRLCPDQLNTAAGSRAPLIFRLASLLVDSGVVYAHLVAPPDLEHLMPPIGATWRDFVHPFGRAVADDPHSRWGDSTWVFERFMESVTPSQRPALYFLHLNVPHLPWKYLPSGSEYGPLNAPLYPHGVRGEIWVDDEWEVTQGWQRHLLQLANADRILGRLLDRLHEIDLFDESMIVVTADHGVSFRAGEGRRPVTGNNATDILGVPLFVKLPGQNESRLDDEGAQVIDIVPTIADVLGVSSPWSFDGQSLVAADREAVSHRTVFRNDGNRLGERLEYPAGVGDRQNTLSRMHRIFGARGGLDELYRIGPDADFIGMPPSADTEGAPAPFTVELEEGWAFDDVDMNGPVIPAHVIGHLRGGEDPRAPVPLVVTVNGVIQASTRTYETRGVYRDFTAMVPESSFVNGSNRVEILMVETADSSRSLRQLTTLGSSSWSLSERSGGAELTSSDGRVATVGSAVHGEVDLNALTISGWAFDRGRGRPVDAVVVFLDGAFLFQGAATKHVPEVGRRFGDSRLNGSGFQFTIPYSSVADRDPRTLRVFAVSGDQAAELTPFGSQRAAPGAVTGPTPTPRHLDLEGTAVPVVTDTVSGWVDGFEWGTEGLVLYGWAAELEQSRPATHVAAVVDGAVVSVAQIDLDRGDVAAYYSDPEIRRSGWMLVVPRVACPEPALCGLEVFGVTEDDRASSLGILVDLRQPDLAAGS